MNRSSLVPRWLYLAFACVMLALGIIGIVLPVLPTTPFILLAAWAAARGSTRLHRWLIKHRTFGPLIRDWQAQGAVRRSNKWLATITMLACARIGAPHTVVFGGFSAEALAGRIADSEAKLIITAE